MTLDEILQSLCREAYWYGESSGDYDFNNYNISNKFRQAKADLKSLLLGMLPEKKEIFKLSTDYRYGKKTQHGMFLYNEAIDDMHKSISAL